MLMHGCKEGQCAACKSFLLDGEVDLDRYSKFALNDFEKEEGWTLLCRAHAESDLEVELNNYDEEVLRSGIALQTVKMRIEAIEELTHDIRRLVLRPGRDRDGPSSSTSSTSTSRSPARRATTGRSGWRTFRPTLRATRVHDQDVSGREVLRLLADGGITPGQEVEVTGPYGVFTLRETTGRPLVFIGGGAGMAPILALLRSMVRRAASARRPTTTGLGPGGLFELAELERGSRHIRRASSPPSTARTRSGTATRLGH